MKLKGFFKIATKEIRKVAPSQYKHNKPGEPSCSSCKLDVNVKSPKIGLRGEGRLGVLIIAEGPGSNEDILNDNLVGDVGLFLEEKLKEYSIDMRRDCKTINAVNCCPPGARKPTKSEIKFCRPLVLKAIEEYKPKFIWLMGSAAVESYFMDKFSRLKITRWLNWTIPDTEKGCWVMPIYHPSYPYKTRHKNPNLNSEYQRQLLSIVDRTIELYDRPRPSPVDYESQVVVLKEYEDVTGYLKYVLKEKPPIVIDYETTGKKPFKKGHRIVIIGIDDGKGAVSFPYQVLRYWSEKQLDVIKYLMKKILTDPKIKKTAQNMKFEMVWSDIIFGIESAGWEWCTMINSHILDSRKEITGLKFQAFVRFGVVGYDAEIKHYLRSDEEFNNIDEAPLDKLLIYCGMDCLFTRMLREYQEKEIADKPGLKRAIDFFSASQPALARMQKRGIPASKQYYLEEKERLTKAMDFIEKFLQSSKEAKKFRKITGRPLNLNSSKDLQELFFTQMKITPVRKTKTGDSTDAETLTAINIPFTKRLLKLKKLKKVRDTYLAQFLREVVNDRIHPVCTLHIARTYRSSMMDPNFQNIPVREELAKKSCRSGITASKGHRLSENDFGSHEVRIAACYTEDPVLIKYIVDPKGTDMHRDQATELFFLEQLLITHDIRFHTKNGWVFPEFYGSWYKQCAQQLWENIVVVGLKTTEGETVREHLLSKGMKTYQQFENHCRTVEKDFWDKYKVFKKWQEKVLKSYLEKGYVTLFHGFRRGGFLKKNEVINTPIQGSAFHCLLWSLYQTDRIALEEKWESSLINQVHDSIKVDMSPYEQDIVTNTIMRVAQEDIRKEHPWIIVPLEIEPEWTPIDGNWYQKEKVKRIDGNWVGKKSKKIYNLEY